MKPLKLTLPVLTAICGLTLPGYTIDIVNDTWLDGDDSDPASPIYSENGVDSDFDGNLESVWYQGGGGTLDPVGAGGPLRATLAATGSSTWTTYFTPEALPVTLASAGDAIRVSWVFTPSGVNTANTSQNFRLALVNSPAASRLSANGAPGNATYTGYGMFMNMSQTLGNSNPFRLVERANPAATNAFLSGSSDWTGLANGATTGNHGYDSDTEYTFVMTLTRTALDGLEITATMTGGTLDNDGVATLTFTDTTPNGDSFSFDTFGIRPSDAATTASQFDTSLFKVEFIPVPEPSTFVLAGLGLLGAMVWRNRFGR